MRSFEFARKLTEGNLTFDEEGNVGLAYPLAQLPEYASKHAAGADFFCAEDTIIKPIWESVFSLCGTRIGNAFKALVGKEISESEKANIQSALSPVKIHTGIKAQLEDDEVLELYNKSGSTRKAGLYLASGVEVIDCDYYNNAVNDGEITFSFYNILPWTITVKAGEKIGQGVFKKYLRPVEGLRVKE
jgi:dUTP pyrophosphatase